MKRKIFHNSLTFREDYQFQGSVQFAQQLCLSLDTPQNPEVFLFKKRRKCQISTTPGVDLRNPWKYRVMVGKEILGEELTIEEALELVKGRR